MIEWKDKRRRRPAQVHDWDALYKEFLESGQTKKAFLNSKCIDPTHPSARTWTTKIWKSRQAVKEALKDREQDTPTQIADLMGIIHTWSLGLAQKHYTAANMLRLHAELYLEKHLVIEHGQASATKMTPREMNAIAQVLTQCQKMERLALGLSTENVAANHVQAPGVQDGAQTEPAATQEPLPAEERRGPIFVVEVNQNGKFVRPRPRMQLQIAAASSSDRKTG